MKKIILSIMVLFAIKTTAQTQQHVVDSLFQFIDKSPITSNIFMDRVFASSGIQEFNQGTKIKRRIFSKRSRCECL